MRWKGAIWTSGGGAQINGKLPIPTSERCRGWDGHFLTIRHALCLNHTDGLKDGVVSQLLTPSGPEQDVRPNCQRIFYTYSWSLEKDV